MSYSIFTVQSTFDIRDFRSQVDAKLRKLIKIKDYREIKVATGEEILRLARKNDYIPYGNSDPPQYDKNAGTLEESGHVNKKGVIVFNPKQVRHLKDGGTYIAQYGEAQYHLHTWNPKAVRFKGINQNSTDEWIDVTIQNHTPEISKRVAQIYKRIWERDSGGG